MKFTLFLTVLVILAASLCALITAPSPTPLPSPSPAADTSITFSVKTDDTITTVNMADYLPGVLAGEMPALFETQALMAQAVAARTYILHRAENGSANHPNADICNNPACCKAYATIDQLKENWGDHFDEYHKRISDAVTGTDGQYLTYNGNSHQCGQSGVGSRRPQLYLTGGVLPRSTESTAICKVSRTDFLRHSRCMVR